MVGEGQFIMEDSSVKHNLLLLQFAVQFVVKLSSVVEQHLGQLLDLALDIEMKTLPPGPVLHHKVTFILCLNKEGRSLHLGEGVLQIVMQIVEVEIKVSDSPTQLQKSSSVACFRCQGDEILAHALIELLILQPQHLHATLAHLANLSLRVGVSSWEGILLYVQLLFNLSSSQTMRKFIRCMRFNNLLPHVVPKFILDKLHHILEDKSIHFREYFSSLHHLKFRKLSHL